MAVPPRSSYSIVHEPTDFFHQFQSAFRQLLVAKKIRDCLPCITSILKETSNLFKD